MSTPRYITSSMVGHQLAVGTRMWRGRVRAAEPESRADQRQRKRIKAIAKASKRRNR